MKHRLSRRTFLGTTGAATLGFLGMRSALLHSRPVMLRSREYGEAIQDPLGVFDLPPGFSYSVIARKGTTMTDGLTVPGKPDGMASFAVDAHRVAIICNHEIFPTWKKESPFGANDALLSQAIKAKMYDAGGEAPSLGGTSTIIYNESTGKTEQHFLSLAGTNNNCAGGATPWGSWLTCEENVNKAGIHGAQDHGWVFEVPVTTAPALARATPIRSMGRFNHEAVCADPRTGIIYLTEDRNDGCFYRWIPNRPGEPGAGGTLQALALRQGKSFDTRNWDKGAQPMEIGKKYAVDWISLSNTDSPEDDLRNRAQEAGAAVFARGEGAWFGKAEAYFACTSGGPATLGQIFCYTPSPDEGKNGEKSNPATLEIFVEPNNQNVLFNCDNLCVAPNGDLFLCEDTAKSRIVRITPDGRISHFAFNRYADSEMAGVNFSPSGKTMFVNIQQIGLTLAITGPWAS